MISTGKTKTCMQCETRFATSNSRRLFCSDRCKVAFSRENRSCFYCGDVADSKDHVVPHSVSPAANGNRQWSVDWVNCCKECNQYLGNYLGSSFHARIMYLHDKFKRKKKLHKGFVEWSDEDLEDMSGDMRTWIWNKQQARMRDERRLSHMKIMALKVVDFDDDLGASSVELDERKENDEL